MCRARKAVEGAVGRVAIQRRRREAPERRRDGRGRGAVAGDGGVDVQDPQIALGRAAREPVVDGGLPGREVVVGRDERRDRGQERVRRRRAANDGAQTVR